jgi:nitrite reductase/ring-hydroxylating ferredoxin subunit
MRWVVVAGERVLLANVDGTLYALRDACGHRQAALSRGTLDGHAVECPLHYARFDVRTGKLLCGPTSADVPTYEVRVEDGLVYVRR